VTKAVQLPPLQYLQECFYLDETNNRLFWRERPRKHFRRDPEWKRHNRRFAGTEALCTVSKQGYLYGALGRKIYLTHRVIWKLKTGKEPPPVIDHRDGNKQNNAWENLREATHAQNCMNRKQGSRCSGYRGVYPSRKRWMARMNSPHRMYLGTFDTPEEAFAARLAAEQKFYGEFAP
jgi:hypothetical protein